MIIVTCVIIAVGIKEFINIYVRINNDPGVVRGTVFMLRLSEDGNAPINDPAIPERREQCYY